MGEKGPEKSSPKAQPKAQPPAQPARQPDQLLQPFLDKASDVLKNFSRKDLADIVSAPLVKGLNAVKEAKDYALKKVAKITVHELYLRRVLSSQVLFDRFLKTEEEKNEWLDMLAAIYLNIGEEEFEEILKIFDSIVINKLDGLNKPIKEKPDFFKIELLRGLLEISKSMPEHIPFLAKKYLIEDYADRAYTPKELQDKKVYVSRSFTLPEMVDILKQYELKGQTIIEFIDAQKNNGDFKARKKFILNHLEQLKKLIPYFAFEGDARTLALFNIDLLNDGDHIETLQRLLGIDPKTETYTPKAKIIRHPYKRDFDRQYIKDHGTKLLQMGYDFDLPSRREMDRNGKLFVEMVATTGQLSPYIINKDFLKNYKKLGWATMTFYDDYVWSPSKSHELLKALSDPGNQELLDSFGEIAIAMEQELQRFLTTTMYPNATSDEKMRIDREISDAKRKIKKTIATEFFKCLLGESSIFEAKGLIENYNRYPRFVAILLERSSVVDGQYPDVSRRGIDAIDYDDNLFEDVNYLIDILSESFSDKNYYRKSVAALELMPDIRIAGFEYHKRTGLKKRRYPVTDLLFNKEKLDLLYRNKKFIRKFLDKTKIIELDNPEYAEYFVDHFPFWAAEKHQDKLWKLASKYSPKVLQGLLLFKIKDEKDLNFYLENSKALGWLDSITVDLNDEKFKEKTTGLYKILDIKKSLFASLPSQYAMIKWNSDLHALSEIIKQEADVTKIMQISSTLFNSFPDDEFLEKNGQFFFEILKKAFRGREHPDEWIDTSALYNVKGAISEKELINYIKLLELFSEPFKARVHHIFSNLLKEDKNFTIETATNILNIFIKHPDLIDKHYSEIEEMFSSLSKIQSLAGKNNFSISYSILPLYLEVKNMDEKVTTKRHQSILRVLKFANLVCKNHDQIHREAMIRLFFNLEGPLLSMQSLKREHLDKAVSNFFDEYGESPDKAELDKFYDTLRGFNNYDISDSKEELEFFTDYAGKVEFVDFDIIRFLGLDKSKSDQANIEDYKEGPFNWERRIQFILFDYKNLKDLRQFDYSKVETYGKIFAKLRGLRTNPEDRIAEAIKIDQFEKEMATKDLFEVEKAINVCRNVISPTFGDNLYKRIMIPKIKNTKIIGERLKKYLGKDASGNFSKIDVTQNNIAEINSIVRLLDEFRKLTKKGVISDSDFAKIVSENISFIFPEFKTTGDTKADIQWLLAKFDVEEINFAKLDNFAEFLAFWELYGRMSENEVKSASKYLENKLGDINFGKMSFDGSEYSLYDLGEVENLRQRINAKNKIMGDMLIHMLGSRFLEENCCSFDNVDKLLRFAKAWEKPEFGRDVNGIYQLYSTYAYVEIASFIKENLEKNRSDKDKYEKDKEHVKTELKKRNIDLDAITKELEAKGFLTLTESDMSKAVGNLKNGMYSYTFRKGASKLLGEESVEFEGKKVKMRESNWSKRGGVKVYSMMAEGREIAKVIKCDPKKINVKVLAEPDGVVNMDAEARDLGKRLIFSAPLTFTTGARKMTELAFRDGVQMNYLLSPHTKDGFLLVNEQGEQKVLNKKRLKISDLIGKEDLQNGEIQDVLMRWANANKFDPNNLEALLNMPIKPAYRFLDKNVFFDLLKVKRYSLLGGMLLIDKQEGTDKGDVIKLDDGTDSRRFYLEFNDGTFGIMDSTESMSSAKMVDLALLAGATKAVYMDTGMYDMATYKDGSGEDHIMGHQDTSESTNRVVIYEK